MISELQVTFMIPFIKGQKDCSQPWIKVVFGNTGELLGVDSAKTQTVKLSRQKGGEREGEDRG